jgi:hypothetical protein
MDYSKIIDELKARRVELETAILALERLAQGAGTRRGRRPKWMAEVSESDTEAEPEDSPKKRALSAEARARIAEAQRKRWAKARKTAKSSQD